MSFKLSTKPISGTDAAVAENKPAEGVAEYAAKIAKQKENDEIAYELAKKNTANSVTKKHSALRNRSRLLSISSKPDKTKESYEYRVANQLVLSSDNSVFAAESSEAIARDRLNGSNSFSYKMDICAMLARA